MKEGSSILVPSVSLFRFGSHSLIRASSLQEVSLELFNAWESALLILLLATTAGSTVAEVCCKGAPSEKSRTDTRNGHHRGSGSNHKSGSTTGLCEGRPLRWGRQLCGRAHPKGVLGSGCRGLGLGLWGCNEYSSLAAIRSASRLHGIPVRTV